MEDRYNVECCDFIHAHEELVEKVRREMPAERCVGDIAALLGMTQSAISHQLRALKNARLVKARREGKTVFYSLADDHVKTIIDQGLEHVAE